MVRLAQRLFAILLLASPLVVGCGESSKSTRDANSPDTVTAADTGGTSDSAVDATVTSDTSPVLPDASTDQTPASPDGTPAKPDGTVDTPAPTTGDAPVDRAADGAGDAGASADSGATD